jgi:hypothetical protein
LLGCPKCGSEYVGVKADFEYWQSRMRYIKRLKCPKCKRQLFTLDQFDKIRADYVLNLELVLENLTSDLREQTENAVGGYWGLMNTLNNKLYGYI